MSAIRRLFTCCMVLCCFVSLRNLEAQIIDGLKLKSITVGSGRTAIVSGLVGTARFSSVDGSLYGEFTVMQETGWAVLARNVGSFTIGGSVGYLQDALWAGPYVGVTQTITRSVTVSTLYWPAFLTTAPEDWSDYESRVGHLGLAALGLGPVTLNYALIKFLDEPFNHLPGAAVTLPVAERFSFTIGGTRNTNDKSWMWNLAGTWLLR